MKKKDLKQYGTLLYEITRETDGAELEKRLTSFVQLLAKHQLIYRVDKVIDEYEKHHNTQEGITKITIESVGAVGEEMKGVLKEKIGKIEIETKENQDLIGGAKVEVDGKIIDGSVKGKLEQLKLQLIN